MFAYCRNNPVMCVDPGGHFSWIIVGIIGVCIIAGAILGYNSDEVLGSTVEQQKNQFPEKKTAPRKSLVTRPSFLGRSIRGYA